MFPRLQDDLTRVRIRDVLIEFVSMFNWGVLWGIQTPTPRIEWKAKISLLVHTRFSLPSSRCSVLWLNFLT